jgi:hypothetical protein
MTLDTVAVDKTSDSARQVPTEHPRIGGNIDLRILCTQNSLVIVPPLMSGKGKTPLPSQSLVPITLKFLKCDVTDSVT